MDGLIKSLREYAALNTTDLDDLDLESWIKAPIRRLAALAEKAADELEKRRWIPVEERLPEPGEKVLAFWKYGSETAVDFAYFMDGNMGERWRYKNWVAPPDAITHWMYLPEAPMEAKP